jgi:hypothetical protein
MTTWSPLEEAPGTVLAVSGELTAAAQLGALTVWSDGAQVAQMQGELPNPARPRIAGRVVYWGPYVVDLDRGIERRLPHTPELLPGYRQTAYAWAPDGHAALVSGTWTGPPGPSPAVVALLDPAGGPPVVLWEAADLAPAGLWFGTAAIVVGSRGPRVFDAVGRPLRTLPATTSPFRIEGDAAGARLLVAEHARLTVWDLAGGEALGARTGAWVDAALTPDGTRVVAVDLDGHVRVHRVGPDLPVAGEVPADAPALAVAATDHRLAAAFARVPTVRTTSLAG